MTFLRILVLHTLLLSGLSLVHHLNIHHDDRHIFKIETFGFIAGGKMDITISNFNLHAAKNAYNITHSANNKAKAQQMMNIEQRRLASYKAGFIMRHAESESLAQQDLEFIVEKSLCIFDKVQDHDVLIDLSNPDSWNRKHIEHDVSAAEVGLYSLIFAQCSTIGPVFVTFAMDAAFVNPGPNYLSAGDAPLPTLYLSFFALFAGLLATWIYLLLQKSNHTNVHTIHYYMLVLLALKCITLLCESIRYHYIALFGVSEAWSLIYFVFATLKGVFLFIVILLIGTGYSLIKNYLTEQDKRVILVVLVLQVINNVAMVVLEETAPGSVGYLTWRDILHVVDILGCLAILLPIVWSIRHLR